MTCLSANYRQKRLLILITAKGAWPSTDLLGCGTGCGGAETLQDHDHMGDTEMIVRSKGYTREIEGICERHLYRIAGTCTSVYSNKCYRTQICLRQYAQSNDDRLRKILLDEYLTVVKREEHMAGWDCDSAGVNEINKALRRMVKKHGDEAEVTDTIRILLKIDAVRECVSEVVLSGCTASHCICPIARQRVQDVEKKFYEERQTRLFSEDCLEALRVTEPPKAA